jgi:hypothetical protein
VEPSRGLSRRLRGQQSRTALTRTTRAAWLWSRRSGIIVQNELIEDDEIVDIAGLKVTSAERTALDIARHLPRDLAVRHLDALANATDINAADALMLGERYQRLRGIPRARNELALMDGGAQSPRETYDVAEHSKRFILHRVYEAFGRRGYRPKLHRRS